MPTFLEGPSAAQWQCRFGYCPDWPSAPLNLRTSGDNGARVPLDRATGKKRCRPKTKHQRETYRGGIGRLTVCLFAYESLHPAEMLPQTCMIPTRECTFRPWRSPLESPLD